MASGTRPYSFTDFSNVSLNSVITKVHIENQDLEIVDRLIEPQTIAHFLEFALGGTLPNGKDCELVRMTADELPLLHTSPDPAADETVIIDRVMSRIGSEQDGDRLCLVGKNIHSLKSRLWEGIIPFCEQRWKEKGLDRKDNFDVACQHLSAVCAAFEYLNQPKVMENMRDTFNLIWEHWRELEVMVNRQRGEKQQPSVSVTSLWTTFMTAHIEVMTERAHRWVTVKVSALRPPLLDTLRWHRPVDLDVVDRVQWRTTDALHMLAEITSVADYGIRIPMDGYKGYTAPAAPPNIPPALRSTNWSERGKAYSQRLKQVSHAARYQRIMQARARGETHHVADPAGLHQTALDQINSQHQLRREVRGNPIEPVPREPWIMRSLNQIENPNDRTRGFGLAVYRLTYEQSDAEWNACRQKIEQHIADWGRGQTGSSALKPYLKLHWMDGRALGIPEGDVEGARKHFHDLGLSSFDAQDQVNDRMFLVVDEPSVASYTGPSYSAALPTTRNGEYAGFVLAVDADWDAAEGPDRPDECPGYHGQMRILGSLVWGDLYAMHAAQSALLEDLWPLALDHPNTVYVGPVVPEEIRYWRLQNGLRNVCLRTVADYAHKKINGTPFPVAPTQTIPLPAAHAGTGNAGPSTSPSNPPPESSQGQADNQLRSYLLRAFYRHLRRHNRYREAAMVGEMLVTPPNQTPDMERLRQRMEQEEREVQANPAPPLSQDEEHELERQEFERESSRSSHNSNKESGSQKLKTCNVLEYGANADLSTDLGQPPLDGFDDCKTGGLVDVPKDKYAMSTWALLDKGSAPLAAASAAATGSASVVAVSSCVAVTSSPSDSILSTAAGAYKEVSSSSIVVAVSEITSAASSVSVAIETSIVSSTANNPSVNITSLEAIEPTIVPTSPVVFVPSVFETRTTTTPGEAQTLAAKAEEVGRRGYPAQQPDGQHLHQHIHRGHHRR
ncbi:uncharacterized protein CDV56_108605 [Aspergillus thermomutatus]|uniref:Uncharacterized protein n=1 Tax=Aspergillus thermomutatus TaxID=41047 RepID=A0A397HGD2_ASPTH|nr:uncharacterized protein CDV56_108605 [Aspergillus thermomutatus]RHZ62027.1 hypothetical protein CDV56_108605 [Aspergillus thermomutatus]